MIVPGSIAIETTSIPFVSMLATFAKPPDTYGGIEFSHEWCCGTEMFWTSFLFKNEKTGISSIA